MSSKKTKTLTVIVKAPRQAAAVVEMAGDLDSLQSAVGGYVEVFSDDDISGVDIWLNEEGKLQGLTPNLMVSGDVLCGTVVFARKSSAGNTISLRKGDIQKVLDWCERRAAVSDGRFVRQADVDDYVKNYGSNVMVLNIPSRKA